MISYNAWIHGIIRRRPFESIDKMRLVCGNADILDMAKYLKYNLAWTGGPGRTWSSRSNAWITMWRGTFVNGIVFPAHRRTSMGTGMHV